MADPTSADRSRLQPVPLAPLADRDRLGAALPVPLTSFIGREREVSEVSALLRGDARLVTLTGPGGVGKTRLALAAAGAATHDFLDGTAFVGFAPLVDPDLVLLTIAQTFGVRETGNRSLAERLGVLLGDRRLLLVLDNLEHLTAAAPRLTELLAACPGLTILATSRAVLRLSGEQVYPVLPLALPDAARPRGLAEVAELGAVALFAQRARAADPAFALTAENAAMVVEICRRLDGLPLAIELAAARIRSLSVPSLLARLADRLRLLTGGARDLPERQRTMRATIAWSHDLLDADEQVLFRRLGVFAGGFTLDGAEAAARFGDGPGSDVFDGVSSLLENSLLKKANGPGEPRFEMLETVREFALDQLATSREEAAVRERHAAWCLKLAERVEATAWGREQRAWFDRLQADHDNVRAALAWLLDRDDPGGLRLAAAMGRFWVVRGPILEARAWLDRALAIAMADATPLVQRARVLYAAGMVVFRQWDLPRAEALLAESVTLWRAVGDEQGLAEALFFYSIADQVAATDSLAQFEELLALLTKLDHPLAPYALMNFGVTVHALGDDARAIALIEEAKALLQQHGDQWGVGGSFERLARVAFDRGEAARAVALALTGLNIFWEQEDQAATIECIVCLAAAAAALGRPEQAGRLLGATDWVRESLGIALTWAYDRQRSWEAIRAKLGEDQAVQAIATGRALSMAEAVAEARALATELTTTTPSADPAQRDTYGLSPREAVVLRLIAAGHSNAEIAAALGISPRTATTHASHILNRLGLSSRSELIAFAHRAGLA